jgi:hypothetical protein
MKCALHRQLKVNMSPGSSTMHKPCSSVIPPHQCEPLNLLIPTHAVLALATSTASISPSLFAPIQYGYGNLLVEFPEGP